ncbi:auxin-responsive protein IAA1-like [Phragmites australis]|uniref:auxin-responsive protein IAA1-like n=1 Tax=Phragmites australis TaxID=29695 RepID=UPI002D794578|nr:auxin-responsive protein IAA1-like [Phragmites australis]
MGVFPFQSLALAATVIATMSISRFTVFDPDCGERRSSTNKQRSSSMNKLSLHPLSTKIHEFRTRARVVGWPSVSRNRRNGLPKGKFVKVVMVSAPYQRKVDLEAYTGYEQLLTMLHDKFTSHFTIHECI